jgi:muramoyltetrapeptide carboxypeptidase LdcA involved in peptidoglycan recycling
MFFLGLLLNILNLGVFLGLEIGHTHPAATTPTTTATPPQSAA